MIEQSARKGVVTAGTWCCDHNKLLELWPGEDGLAEIITEERHGGGPGCNMAIDLKKLDPQFFVETIGLIGDDDDGRLLLAEADAHRIERSQLAVTAEAGTNYTDAYTSRASGRRTHIFYQGTSALLTPHHFDFERTSGRILHLGLPGIHRLMDEPWGSDANGWVTVLRKARAAGLQTNMELASLAPKKLADAVLPCLPHLDMLIVNDHEIGALAGTTTSLEGKTDVRACTEAAKALMAHGRMSLVAVHFPNGAVIVERSGSVLLKPSVRVPPGQIVGANGAGDAFAAGVLYALHENWALEAAVTLGHAVAAASLRGMGTADAVESWRECLRLAEQWGWRKGQD